MRVWRLAVTRWERSVGSKVESVMLTHTEDDDLVDMITVNGMSPLAPDATSSDFQCSASSA